MEQLKQFYAQLPKKSFLTVATVLLILCDVLILGYLYYKFSNEAFFQQSLGMSMKLNGINPAHMDPELVINLHQMFHKTLIIMLSLAAFYHVINYICWWKEKKFAIAYVKFLTTIGGPLIVVWGLAILSGGSNLGLLFLIMGAAIFSLKLGMNIHYKE